MGMVTVCAIWAESDGVAVDRTCVESDGVAVDKTCVESDGVTVDRTCAESDGVTVDMGPLLLMGGGRGLVTLAGLMDAVESEGRSGSV